MTAELFNVRPPHEALRILLERLDQRNAAEQVATFDALDRVLAVDLCSPVDLPTFRRSTMDGFAVRAGDTFGASEGLPAYLDVVAEVLMGETADCLLRVGQCARIATGGMIPAAADAVIMVEQTQEVGPRTIEALRPVAPGENVVQVGKDVRAGSAILQRGQVVRPQDVGAMLALGISSVSVSRRLRVAIVSGGDELVEPADVPAPGQIRDINSYTLSAMVSHAGHEPHLAGIFPDDLAALQAGSSAAFAESDVLVFSAGSSVSARDMTARVIHSLGRPGVLVHGVSLKPGKPTVLAVCDGEPVFGLPGNPVSCMVTFDLFVAPTLAYLSGAAQTPQRSQTARLTRNIASVTGREDYVQVRVARAADGAVEATPVFGKSNLIFTLVHADGMVRDSVGLHAVAPSSRRAGQLRRLGKNRLVSQDPRRMPPPAIRGPFQPLHTGWMLGPVPRWGGRRYFQTGLRVWPLPTLWRVLLTSTVV
jgi:molybdopterin molybdotransferase